MKDMMGNRLKTYESIESDRRFVPMLPIYARIDGRSFSKFTRGMQRPFDMNMISAMIETTKYLVSETDAKIGYTQSDEISLVFYAEEADSQVFFDGRVQKLCSVLAGLATAKFLTIAIQTWPDRVEDRLPVFDCRVFTLPNKIETANTFLWREQDATKNAITMAASFYYSHKELMYKTGKEKQEMLFEKGINFNDYPSCFKRGTFVRRQNVLKALSDVELNKIPQEKRPNGPVMRTTINEIEMPPFSKVTNRIGVIFDGEDPQIKI